MTAPRFSAVAGNPDPRLVKPLPARARDRLPVEISSKAFTSSPCAVKVVREREAELVATEKKRLLSLLGHAARLCVEGLIEDPLAYRVSAKLKSVSVGILQDKKGKVDGEAQLRVEHVRKGPTMDNLDGILKFEVVPECHSGGEDVKPHGKRAIDTNWARLGAHCGNRARTIALRDDRNFEFGDGGGESKCREGSERAMDSRERNFAQKDATA
jgi:hypothetical protein